MIALSIPLHILRSYVVVFESEHLFHQTFLEPNPSELVEVTDSGKGRSGK